MNDIGQGQVVRGTQGQVKLYQGVELGLGQVVSRVEVGGRVGVWVTEKGGKKLRHDKNDKKSKKLKKEHKTRT